MARKIRPNIVSGGTAIDLGNNLYYMRGKTHKQGGINIGSNPETGINVEKGEVVQTSPKGLRVFSAQPILNGISPANALLMGGNPNNIFNAQEAWKQVNHYNDDGTKFKIGGDDIPIPNVKKELIKLKNKINNKESIDYNPINKNIVSKNEDIERGYPYLYKGDAGLKFYKKKGVNGIIYGTSKYNESDLSDYEEIPYETVRKMLPKRDYIGGNDYRQRVVDKVPGLKSFIKAKAEEYGISPNLLFHRFLREGIVDRWTNIYNDSIYTDEQESFFRDEAGKMEISGFGDLGLDDVGTNLLEEKYTLKNPNITWEESDAENEHGRQVKSAIFNNIWDGIEVKAAEMAYRQAELAKRGIVGDQFVNAAYNMGLNHKDLNNIDYINKYYSVPNYFEFGGESKSYTPSKEIIDYIKKTEGFRDKWYKDGNGIDTIGYGFTGSRIKKLYPNGITREQADKEFADSIIKRAAILQRDTPNWNKLSQSQRDALLSYHYNVGEGSYRNKHKKLQQALADSDWENVVLNMDAGYNDKKNPGLRTRRDYERELFRSGMVASLTGDEEKAFRTWYDRYSRSQNLDPNPDAKEHYYDYRTYWKNRTPKQMNDEWKLGNHLPDTYKMPGHPTFSVESIYSTRKTPGGTWKKVGLGPVYDEQFFDSKYTKNLRKYQNVSFKYGGIHIKPSKRGTFTAAAKRHHMSVQEFARTVLNNRARYSAAMVKKANFARNASKWHKKELGGDMTKQYYITKDNIYSLGGSSKRKAPLGTQYIVDENGRIVPINIPNTGINIANIGEINRLLDPVTVTDSAPKTPSITGRAEIIPQINQSILAPNSHVIQRRLPVSIQDIVNPITSPIDSALNKPDFNSTMLSVFPNPDFDGTVGTIREKSSTGVASRNPYYSRLNVGLRRAGNYIRNNPDLIGLGVNLTGNLAASLINRSAIKGMRYGDAPIPISAKKLPTEVNIEPQVSSIRENVAGQERLIADNTADSRVALARRQRVRNQGAQQYQTLFGNKLNTELQLLTADRLNRQGVDAQNVTQYNQWRRGLYDFENRRREMLAENSVAGINNAAEAIAGERGYLARKEARKRDLLNMGLIAATSPNAQNVIGSEEFERFLRSIGYDGNFSLLRKRLKG